MTERRNPLAALLDPVGVAIFGALAVLPMLPAIVRGRVPWFSDIANVFHPLRTWTHSARSAGAFASWNPLVGCGVPHATDPQVAWWYPPNWILDRLDPGVAGAAEIAIHSFIAAVAMHVVLRALGVSRVASVAGAAAFQFCPALANEWQAGSAFRSAACGAVMLAGVALLRTGRLRPGFAVTVAGMAGGVLAGHPQFVLVMGLPAAAVAFVRVGSPAPRPKLVLGLWAITVLVAALVAAVAIVPLVEYAPWTQRKFASAQLTGLDAWQFRAMLVSWTRWEWGRSVGLLALALASVAAAVRTRDTLPVVLAVAIGALASLGDRTPFGSAIRHVPLLGSFHYPARWMLGVQSSVCILAAMGFDAWRTSSAERSARVVVAAVCAAACIAALAAPRSPGPLDIVRLGCAFAGLLVIAAGPGMLRAAPVVLALAWPAELAVQVGSSLFREGHTAEIADLHEGPSHLRPIIGRALAGEGRILSAPRPPNGHMRSIPTGVENVRAHLALRPLRSLELAHLANEGDLLGAAQRGTQLYGYGPGPNAPARFLDALGVRWATGFAKSPGPGWRDVGPLVFERELSTSVVRMVPGVAAAASIEEAADRLLDPGFDPSQTAVVEGGAVPGDPVVSPSRVRGVVRDMEGFRVDLGPGNGGWLVASYNHLPGFECTIDGTPAEIRTADVFAMAVRVPAGAREVVFRYVPPGLRTGMMLSVAGMIVFAAVVVVLPRRR